ncbi:MAG: Stp1/IreP family PP2C-type Ser/Thr phosphatase [Desulfobacterales bacterium]|nr:Stp1/IreP family PP2C-type Ser/Thr phosphatase [Desulfobacterales bacterium]
MLETINQKVPKITMYGRTDIGLRRENNEDTYVVEPESGFCLVADGMGGAAAGELASGIFAEIAVDIFEEFRGQSEQETLEYVQKTFRLANERILDHVKENPHHKGMGCTAELLAFSNTGFVLGHIGDSRTYRFRNGQLKQLTQDHSLVQDQINQGIITSTEARTHPMRNIILRAVGIKEKVSLDLIRGKTVSGDFFLLCSDGLTDMVDDHDIERILSLHHPLPQKVEELIAIAKSAGGKDNITVVLSEML